MEDQATLSDLSARIAELRSLMKERAQTCPEEAAEFKKKKAGRKKLVKTARKLKMQVAPASIAKWTRSLHGMENVRRDTERRMADVKEQLHSLLLENAALQRNNEMASERLAALRILIEQEAPGFDYIQMTRQNAEILEKPDPFSDDVLKRAHIDYATVFQFAPSVAQIEAAAAELREKSAKTQQKVAKLLAEPTPTLPSSPEETSSKPSGAEEQSQSQMALPSEPKQQCEVCEENDAVWDITFEDEESEHGIETILTCEDCKDEVDFQVLIEKIN